MTSGSALFDTNILIDLFSGRREAKQALEAWLRQEYKLKLPDAIILATAQLHRLELITRNTKDFAGIPGVVTPYEIHPE